MNYICFFSKAQSEYSVFNILELTEETMNCREFENKFNPSKCNNAYYNICTICPSIEEYNDTKNTYINVKQYNDFVYKQAALDFREDHGNNYVGPSNIFATYINNVKTTHPIQEFTS
jgi:hypothetical protein